MKPLPVAVVGAGVAGLTAARVLKRRGIPVVLFEAGPKIAGLAGSFQDEDGFSHDFGAHFITNRLAAALGVGARCRTVRRYAETVWLRGRSYGYPFGLLRRPRYVLGALRARAAALGAAGPPATAAEWFRAAYGRPLADEVALPLVEAWSGMPAERLAASVGGKIPASLLGTILLKLAARLTSRAVAIGYCRELPQSPHVWHVYPEGGVEVLCRRLADGLDGEIRLNARVESILVNDGRVAALKVNGSELGVAAVVSTAPVHILARLVTGSDALADQARFRYRPMVFVNLRLRGRGLLPEVVTWTPEPALPFFRLTEATLAMPQLAPPDKTLITADIGCEVGDATWSLPDDALGERCIEGLGTMVRDAASRYLGCRVLRTPVAYPVFLREYEEARIRWQRSSGVRGLVSVGRNGEFDHLLMEDVHWRTLGRTRRLADELLGSADREPGGL
jgi:protoporphyrinogen oxidase